MASVNVESVEKVYKSSGNNIVAVDNISLSIKDGEFVTIVGPSGSGKSTLLRMIAGLESISGGSITIGGQKINDIPPQDRGVAMVFQEYALYPHMNVRENMSYGLNLNSNLGSSDINKRVEEAAEMMNIQDLLEKKPGNLSGGQQQRVATGRAIVRDPKVFLFDEPLSNLDAKLRLHMRTELQRIQEELGTTSVYVTHDQTEAMTMSDRIVILNHGKIQQVGTPRQVYAQPHNQFVANFIGSPSMNFYNVRFKENMLYSQDFEYEIPDSTRNMIENNTEREDLILGIRPEHITIADSATNQKINTHLDVIEHEGSDNYLYLRKGDITMTARVPGDVDYQEGNNIPVSIPSEHIHIFDSKSGKNVLIQETNEVKSQTIAR